MPKSFATEGRDQVTVEASFSEHPFVPDIVMKSDDYHAVGPAGDRISVTPAYFKELALFEVPTSRDGTYRITTGDREGRIAKAALIKGEWQFLDPRQPVAAGINAVDMQSITKAEAYVSRGEPDMAALAPTGRGLEFRAVTHPNLIQAGRPADFVLLFQGKPLGGEEVTLVQGETTGDENITTVTVRSRPDGRFTLQPHTPGLYFAMSRHRVAAAEGQPAKSFTYALSFSANQ